MFEWLKGLFGKKAPSAPPAEAPARSDLFAPQDRLIYSYLCGYAPDGSPQFKRVDPLEMWRKVMAHGPRIAAAVKVAASQSKAAGVKLDELAATVRELFGIGPVEEGGLPVPHLLELLGHFMDYCGVVKKNSAPSTTYAWETSPDTPSSERPTAPDDPTTTTTSDSGSTAAGDSTDPPTPLNSGSRSPSGGSTPASSSTAP